MNAAELLATLQQSLATVYPVSRNFGKRPGRVSCVIVPTSLTWEDGPDCDPWPMSLEVEVTVQAADVSEQGAHDLMHHAGPVSRLIRQAGFRPTGWRAESANDVPAIVIAATAHGEEG